MNPGAIFAYLVAGLLAVVVASSLVGWTVGYSRRRRSRPERAVHRSAWAARLALVAVAVPLAVALLVAGWAPASYATVAALALLLSLSFWAAAAHGPHPGSQLAQVTATPPIPPKPPG